MQQGIDMTYTLNITESDFDTILFVGGRYDWSDACRNLLSVGENNVSEVDAWDLRDAFEGDCEGGHSPFPMLAPGELRDKLISFWDSIV
jgi:hypothetical protein